MNADKSDLLVAACQKLQCALAEDSRTRELKWMEVVHSALGQLASAIQAEIQAAEKSMETIGEINPDFQNAPVTERHIQTARAHLIKLGEKVHQLRADLRTACCDGIGASAQIHRRGKEICNAVEDLRQEDNEFLLTTLNSNPGAGE